MLNQQSQCVEKLIPIYRDWFARQHWTLQAGMVIGAAHLLLMLGNIVYIIQHHEGHWHMFWVLCGYVDFPASLLLSKAILPVLKPYLCYMDPYLEARYGLPFFWVFSLFHILVGSAWYAALPVLVHKISRAITATRIKAAAAATMMLIPIPANWIQLLRFFGRDTAPTAIGLNSVLPCVWMGLLVWLFITNPKRKAMLWLFCLAPPVFYYLAADLYYYFFLAIH